MSGTRDSSRLAIARLDSPVGPLALFVRQRALVALAFSDSEPRTLDALERRLGPLELVAGAPTAPFEAALEAYFAGQLGAIDALVVDAGGTAFEQRVWAQLRAIPAGETRSYLDVARALGDPGALRAVGQANAANPVPIVVPCHRVVAADGRLGGYGGGLQRKRWLLRHEGARGEWGQLPLWEP